MSQNSRLDTMTRRLFLLSTAGLAAGCATATRNTEAGARTVRAPAVGQSWRYAKHDLVTGKRLDVQVDRVTAVGRVVELSSHSERNNDPAPPDRSWGAEWLRPYGERTQSGTAGPLPSEIQAPWGKVLVDPHWAEVQVFRDPLPLWPTELRPGWSATFNTLYKTPESGDELPWQLSMTAHSWESLSVPAGRFRALRFTNLINFRYTNVSEKVAGRRIETIWLAPELGRWIVRESSGSFYQDVGEEFSEQAHRWELLGFT